MSGRAIELASSGPERTEAVGEALAQVCRAGDLLGLRGELGAGKTCLIRGLARGLGLDERAVSSPTFVIAQEYEPEAPEGALTLVHVDAYRLAGAGELETIGWEGEGWGLREGAVVAVEWAERVAGGLGEDWLELRIDHTESGRRVRLLAHGAWADRMEAVREALRTVL